MMINNPKQITIYQGKNGPVKLRVDVKSETIWASQSEIARVFVTDRSVITKHIINILKNREVNGKSNVQKMHISNSDKSVIILQK